ncbi:DUF1007 family protein [uncultured Thiothrix sp.]|uniref:DUF1007 family protein n=1 Tax=uncultured Thiothrix sp. TaxID=223185 RepID=UPI0026218C16|nr:DUF1007 family protein [uncultured Thiothrix sp.]HMT93214.1 DUF1007 family protein [Thiolinea sp.]
MLQASKLRLPIVQHLMLSLLLVGLIPTTQADGYHYQIKTSAKFLANTASELTAIQLAWTYAPNEGQQLLADKDLSATHRDASLKTLGQAMLDDLFESGYYTQLAIDGQPVLLNKVQTYRVSTDDDLSLTLDFTLPLKTATKLSAKQVSLRLVDPDGVATVVFNKQPELSLDEVLAKTCTVPNLSEETLKLPNGHEPNVPTIQFSCQ